MKFVFSLFLVVISVSLFASSVNGFEGGDFKIKIGTYINGFTGSSSQLANLGNTISSTSTDPFAFTNNPAAITGYDRLFSLEIAAPLYLDPSAFYDLENKVENKINTLSSIGDDAVYPGLNMKIGQRGGFKNFAYNFSVQDKHRFGIAMQKAFYLDFELLGNGMKGIFEEESGGDTTRVFLNSDLYSNLNIDVNSVNLCWARTINQTLNLGIGLDILQGKIASDATLLINGAIRQQGAEADIYQTFENPVDAQYFRNTLNDSIFADLDFNLISPQAGLNYQPHENIYLDLVVQIPVSAKINGEIDVVTHTLSALDAEELIAGGDDILDITQFDPSKMTFTNRIRYQKKKMSLDYPGKVAFAFSYSKPKLDLILSYEKSLGMLTVDYDGVILEDGKRKVEGGFEFYETEKSRKYSLSLDLKHSIKFGLNLKNLFGAFDLSGGAQLFFIDYITKNVDSRNDLYSQKNLLIPSASGGFGFNLSRNLRYDCNLLSFPGPMLRSNLTYRF